MRTRLILTPDFASGLLFLLIGGAVALASTAHKIGTTMRMGPGYFPLVLGVILAAIGLILVVRNVRLDINASESAFIERICFRSVILISLSMLLFAFTVQKAGLIIATCGLVLVSGVAYRAFSWKQLGLLCIALAGFATVVFIYGLGLPVPVLPA